MTRIDLNQALHVCGGPSAAGLIRQAFGLKRDQLLVTEDTLSIGPAPATADLQLWRAIRGRFFSELHDGPDAPYNGHFPKDLDAERLLRCGLVVVWAGVGLPEQLLVAQVVVLFEQLGLDHSKLQVVQFETSDHGPLIRSVGMLDPEDARKHCPDQHPLSSGELSEFKHAWNAYTSSKPSEQANYLVRPVRSPILHRAMSQLVYRYPDVRSGLSTWDERLLRYAVEQGPGVARVLASTVDSSDTPDLVGDVYLFRRLVRLAQPSLVSPLVSVTGSVGKLRESKVTLTAFGREVLAGEANHVRQNGIDDWIGGVHLISAAPITFRKGDSLILPK